MVVAFDVNPEVARIFPGNALAVEEIAADHAVVSPLLDVAWFCRNEWPKVIVEHPDAVRPIHPVDAAVALPV